MDEAGTRFSPLAPGRLGFEINMGDDAEDEREDRAGLLVLRIRIVPVSLSPDVGVGVFSFDDDAISLGRSAVVFVVARRRRVVASAPLSVSCSLSRPFRALAVFPFPLMISCPSPLSRLVYS